MTYGKINSIAETYLNGNIGDAKKAVKRMSKRDIYFLLERLTVHHQGPRGMEPNNYYQAIKDFEILTR